MPNEPISEARANFVLQTYQAAKEWKKIIIVSDRSIKFKDTDNNVIEYNFEHVLPKVSHRGDRDDETLQFITTSWREQLVFAAEYITDSTYRQVRKDILGMILPISSAYQRDNSVPISKIVNHLTTYPVYWWVADGETETDEVATRTILFPPPETLSEWAERFEPRITFLARCWAEGIPMNFTLTASENEMIDETSTYGARYKSTKDAGKNAIGFIRWQFDKLVAGTTSDLTRAELETNLELLEANATDLEWIKNFYVKHNHTRWSSLSKRGQIHIPTETFELGDVLHDTFAAQQTRRGESTTTVRAKPEVEADMQAADAELLEIQNAYGTAVHSHATEMITHRTVTIPDPPTPPPADDE